MTNATVPSESAGGDRPARDAVASPVASAPGLVSVVIAAYDAEAFIARTIASACGQTVPPLEVLVVDDASTDGTREVVQEFARADPRVRLIASERNGGPAAARNIGFAEAKGEWIAVLDADDTYAPDRLARLVALATSERADMVADNIRFYDAVADTLSSEGGITSMTEATRVIDLATFLDWARPGTGEMDWGLLKPLFRRAFMQETALRYPPDCRHGEDVLLVIEALLAGARYVVAKEPGYNYTLRNSGMSRTRIDYRRMVRDTRALRQRPTIARDAELIRALRVREAAVRRLAADRHFDLSVERRDVPGVLYAAAASPRIARRLLGLVAGRTLARA